MAAGARLAQLEYRASRHHLAPMRDERLDQVLQVEDARLAVDQRHHVHMEGVLQLRHLEQIVEHDLRDLAALELDHHAHARLVGFVAQVGDALEALFGDELGELLEQHLLVHLVGQLIDDDRLAIALADLLEVRARTHDYAPAPGAVALVGASDAVDDSRGREVGCRHQLDHFFDRAARVLEHMQRRVDHFAEVVRRNVGRHAHGDARRAVDEQVGGPRRQDHRLALLAVVVRHEIDGLGLDVGQNLGGESLQPAFGVAVRGRRIAVDRAEVALPIDQRVAHGEVLRHAHQRLVGRRIAVRVVLPQHLADDARALHIRPVPHVVGLVHGEENSAVHGLQAVAHIGQRTPHDHAHCVVEVGTPHLLLE